MCLPPFPQWVKVQLRLGMSSSGKAGRGRAGAGLSGWSPFTEDRLGGGAGSRCPKQDDWTQCPVGPSFLSTPSPERARGMFFLLPPPPTRFPYRTLGLRDITPGDPVSATSSWPSLIPGLCVARKTAPLPSCFLYGAVWSRGRRRCPRRIWHSLRRGSLCCSQ